MLGLNDEQILADMLTRWESVPARARVVRIYGIGSERATRLMDAFGASLGTCDGTADGPEAAESPERPAEENV